MKAITLWEPWASAMALGKKGIETRHWLTAYRGDLAICSAKRRMTAEDLDSMEIVVEPPNGYIIPYGCCVCVVELFDCIPTPLAILHGISDTEYMLGDYTPGRWAWLTRNRRRLRTPVPIVGRQALWNLDPCNS